MKWTLRLTKKIIEIVRRELRRQPVYNRDTIAYGKVESVTADGKFAAVIINGATPATPSVPIVAGLSLVAGDEVIIIVPSVEAQFIAFKRMT